MLVITEIIVRSTRSSRPSIYVYESRKSGNGAPMRPKAVADRALCRSVLLVRHAIFDRGRACSSLLRDHGVAHVRSSVLCHHRVSVVTLVAHVSELRDDMVPVER